ncbi:hypothetical protein MP638_007337 [Amoeboaphelidium occidentale]|nr:hypothetical protein MP638_007337 [Amoeboaphelidium occidentale]
MQWYEFFDAAIDGKGWLQSFSRRYNDSNILIEIDSVSDLNNELNLHIPEYSEDFIEML